MSHFRIFDREFFRANQCLVLACLIWLATVIVISLRASGHPCAFSEYREAGTLWLEQKPVYGVLDTPFLYSPLAAAVYSFFALIPQQFATCLGRFIEGIALGFALFAGGRVLCKFNANELAASLLLVLPLCIRNLNSGQANLLVLTLSILAFAAAERARWVTCAVCIAVMSYWKVYPLAIGLVLTVLHPRQLSWRLALALAGLFVLSLGLQRPQYVWNEYGEWLRYLSSVQQDHFTEYTSKWRDAYLLARLAGTHPSAAAWNYFQMGAGGLVALVSWWVSRQPSLRSQSASTVLALCFVWTLLFGPGIEAATYVLLSFPVVCLAIAAWREQALGLCGVLGMVYLVLFIYAFALVSLPRTQQIALVHMGQPCAALVFCAGLLWWLARRIVSERPVYCADSFLPETR